MKITVSLDDRVGERVKRRAAREGLSVSAYVSRLLHSALDGNDLEPVPRFRLVTVGEGGVHRGVDLDSPAALLAADDEVR